MKQSETCVKQDQETPEIKEPEFFERALLLQLPGVRQEYFERHCLIEHPRLLEALETTVRTICSPGAGSQLRRPGTMALVIGPSRVGKTTLIRLLEEHLLIYAKAQMQHDPTYIPFASITAPEPGVGGFDWTDYYRQVLRQLGNPFVDSKTAPIHVRAMREAVGAALIHREPLAIIVDEAQHLAKVRSGRKLQDHLDHLKHFENLTGVSHILVGTYDMRPFRKVNAQLACRSVDVHFPRYDLMKDEDCQIFRSVLWALQRQMPMEEEPLLVEHHWEFLYARSIGCIGLLKMHLNQALNLALLEGARTVTETHLRKTAPSDIRVKLALRTALESEAEFVEAEDANEQLLALLGRAFPGGSAQRKGTRGPSDQAQTRAIKRKPGKRAEGRDTTGQAADEGTSHDQASKERAAG